MTRVLALIGALLLAFLSVSSACTAASSDWIQFTLRSNDAREGSIRTEFQSGPSGRHENNWSTDFRPADLRGLDLAGFRSAGSRPLRFALIREAGRLDCSGAGGNSRAEGNCSFTPDPGFMQLLLSRGIGRPTREQALGLTAVDARRELIDALAAARYPTPSIDNLMALSALDVGGSYISEMAAAGYRPRTLDGLIQFKALDITPQWIAGFARIGYADLPADELVQLRALDITPQYISGFDRAGYRHLPVDKLVQLKAMDITPEFVRAVAGDDSALPDMGKLIELKTFGERH